MRFTHRKHLYPVDTGDTDRLTTKRKMSDLGMAVTARSFACRAMNFRMAVLFAIISLLDMTGVHSQRLYFDDCEIDVLIDTVKVVKLRQSGKFNTTLTMTSVVMHPDVIEVTPESLQITEDKSYKINLRGTRLGNTEIAFEFSPAGYVKENSVFLHIAVMHSNILKIVSTIMGWIYFAAWSISFYPQIYINFMRKSVIGLNFDFLALNIVGFSLYSFFNCGMYFFPCIQEEYFKRHPRGINPVFMNDVFFSLHAVFATVLTITQCFLYVRGNQRVSTNTRGILCAFFGVLVASVGLTIAGRIHWLDCLYNCSYIKLCTTLIKYMPQAYMNYKRKSTVGWSIGNILLDFLGGALSVLQKVVNGYNYNDWSSFFGNFTKLGIGVFSLSFDIFFIIQHYVLYRDRSDRDAPNAKRLSKTKPPPPPKHPTPSILSIPPPPPPPPPPPERPGAPVRNPTPTIPLDMPQAPTWRPSRNTPPA